MSRTTFKTFPLLLVAALLLAVAARTPMSASFHDYPNTHFSQALKTTILNGP